MSDSFDPCHIWLGISPKDQPPNHYRLLGIDLLESDPNVIESAADRQMSHVRTFQTGRHSAESQEVLNEIAAAKVCLLNPAKKAAYDQRLRQKLRAEGEATPQTLPKAELVESVEHTTPPGEAIPSIMVSTRRRRRRGKNPLPWQVPVLAVSLVVVGVLVYFLSSNRAPPAPPPPSTALVFEWPVGKREEATLVIGGRSVTVPRKGPVEFACGPGRYRYVAGRPGFVRVVGTVTVRAGQGVKIPLTWMRLAVLVFEWPEDQRVDAKLLIDRKSVEVPSTGPCEYRLPPGKRRFVARRPGSKPLEQTVMLEARAERIVKVDWQELPPPPPEAVLVLHWPKDQRVDATLLIDGKPVKVPATDPCEYRLEPGQHRIVVDRPGFERFEQIVTLAARQGTIVEVVLDKPERVAKPPGAPPPRPHVTLNLEKERFAYDLETDKPLPEGKLYVEIWGPESWAVPAEFERDKKQVPLNGKVTIKLKGKVTIKWSQIPGAEIGVKFIRSTDGLKLQIESVYKARGGIEWALTPSKIKNLKKALPTNLDEANERFLYLDRVGPELSRKLQVLQAKLARELSKGPRSRNPAKTMSLRAGIQGLSNDIERGRKEYGRLLEQIPRLKRLVQVLPTLDHLVNSLHNSAKLYYRVFTKTNDDG